MVKHIKIACIETETDGCMIFRVIEQTEFGKWFGLEGQDYYTHGYVTLRASGERGISFDYDTGEIEVQLGTYLDSTFPYACNDTWSAIYDAFMAYNEEFKGLAGKSDKSAPLVDGGSETKESIGFGWQIIG